MERAALIIEDALALRRRLDFVFNPDHLVFERVGGIRPRTVAGARISGRAVSQDPLLFTGGGSTVLTLKLLFDTAGTSSGSMGAERPDVDVRTLTDPLWSLTEGRQEITGSASPPPRTRFVWGKAWNLPVVILALAQRLDRFSPNGLPTRAWVHLRLRTLPEDTPPPGPGADAQAEERAKEALAQFEAGSFSDPSESFTHVLQPGETLDGIATQYYHNAYFWRLIARANFIVDPMRLDVGHPIVIPVVVQSASPGRTEPRS